MQQQFLVGLSYGQESAKQNFDPTGVQRSKMHCSLYQPFNDLPYESSDQAAGTSVPRLIRSKPSLREGAVSQPMHEILLSPINSNTHDDLN